MADEFQKQSTVVMYILVRTDMASMNTGKAIAQGSHAANKCIWVGRRKEDPSLHAMIDEWENQAAGQGFGTVLTLGVTDRQMRAHVLQAQVLGAHADLMLDPTYPLLDGKTLHLIPVETCAYVFGKKEVVSLALQGLDLHP